MISIAVDSRWQGTFKYCHIESDGESGENWENMVLGHLGNR